jgi:hypothetical protein
MLHILKNSVFWDMQKYINYDLKLQLVSVSRQEASIELGLHSF